MYDLIKRKCNAAIWYLNIYEKKYGNDPLQKGIAIGSKMAYRQILEQLKQNEEYINRQKRKTENPCVSGSIPLRGTK